MQGLQTRVFLAAALLWFATCGFAQTRAPSPEQLVAPPIKVAAEESPWFSRLDQRSGSTLEPLTLSVPGASFIKVHFKYLDVPFGILVEVSNPQGTEVYRYAKGYLDAHTLDRTRGDDGMRSFSAMSINGDTAIVRILDFNGSRNTQAWQVEIDSILHGLPDEQAPAPAGPIEKALGKGTSAPQFACGEAERLDAVCWEQDFPAHYDRSRPVAKLVTARGFQCTAWRVGEENRLFTAEHCITSQEELEGSEIWFNYETTSCGSDEYRNVVKVSGDQLLASDPTLDFSLFTVHEFESIASFGNLGLDVRTGTIGENIFIPQHGLGRPRQIALESDMNVSGLCEIDDTDVDAYGDGTDIGYFCDTTTSSSGSPVISSSTGKVIALHHLGGCLNMGSKVSMIWPLVRDHFSGEVPQGNSEHAWAPSNQLPEAEFQASCEALSCQFDAAASDDPDGAITTYSWDFGDGHQSSGTVVKHEFDSAGEFPVTLTIEDNEGARDSTSTQVVVSSPNQEPTASFSYVCIENECSFNGTGSADPDGQVSAWRWELGDGNQADGTAVDHLFDEAGVYTVSLTVSDEEGATGKTSRTIDIQLPNAAPEARFTVSCEELTCTFDAGKSSDSDGELVTWSWTLDDGSTLEGSRVSHEFDNGGTYSITLLVTDNEGATKSRKQTVLVSEKRVIELSGKGNFGAKGTMAFLQWKGAETRNVTILRNGEPLITTDNTGRFTDQQLKHDLKSARYQLCEAPSGICSAIITVELNRR